MPPSSTPTCCVLVIDSPAPLASAALAAGGAAACSVATDSAGLANVPELRAFCLRASASFRKYAFISSSEAKARMFLLAVFLVVPRANDAELEDPAQAASANRITRVRVAEKANDVADSANVLTGRKAVFMATIDPFAAE